MIFSKRGINHKIHECVRDVLNNLHRCDITDGLSAFDAGKPVFFQLNYNLFDSAMQYRFIRILNRFWVSAEMAYNGWSTTTHAQPSVIVRKIKK